MTSSLRNKFGLSYNKSWALCRNGLGKDRCGNAVHLDARIKAAIISPRNSSVNLVAYRGFVPSLPVNERPHAQPLALRTAPPLHPCAAPKRSLVSATVLKAVRASLTRRAGVLEECRLPLGIDKGSRVEEAFLSLPLDAPARSSFRPRKLSKFCVCFLHVFLCVCVYDFFGTIKAMNDRNLNTLGTLGRREHL